MISEALWDREWHVVEARWGKQDKELQLRYFEFLGSMLDDAGLVAAVEFVIAGREFFPKMVDFLMPMLQPDYEASMDVIRGYTRVEGLSPIASRCLAMMGGAEALGQSTSMDPLRIRKEFAIMYPAAIQSVAANMQHVQERVQLGSGTKAIGPGERQGTLGRIEVPLIRGETG